MVDTTSEQRRRWVEVLQGALASEAGLQAWLVGQGFAALVEAPTPGRVQLAGAQVWAAAAPEHAGAPRLLVLWRGELTARAARGEVLRRIQHDAYHHRSRVAVADLQQAPDLCVLGCPHFLLLFPLDADPFARRQRFTEAQLAHSAPLAQRFAGLSAASMARWGVALGGATAEDSGEDWSILFAVGRRFDWETHLYGGAQLDQEFVDFVGGERQRLLEEVLDPARQDEALRPMLRALEVPDAGTVQATDLLRKPALRKRVIAAVDTVLLRLVLHRYLEAQAVELDPDELRDVGFGGGTLDEQVDRTATVDAERHARLLRQAAQRNRGTTGGTQMGFDFGAPAEPSVKVHDVEEFIAGVKALSGHYQQSAGGDLHRGSLSDAADRLQDFLLGDEKLRDAFATLIEGTRQSRYTFTYEDLDPRAFQRFYEDTIATDLGFSEAEGRVRVVPRLKNRKEQGAYFTDERLCAWLVERTLGDWFATTWLPGLKARLPTGRALGAGEVEPVRIWLRALGERRILDPTCGGGIFLRGAFNRLAACREQVAVLLEAHLSAEGLAVLQADPVARLLLPGADAGAWEWHLLLNVLYGVDVDLKAINIASNLLTLSALVYRPRGLAFPSFINSHLKRGNALVTPLAPADRAAFAARWTEQLQRLLVLRTEMRDPSLGLERWRTVHAEAAGLVRTVGEAEAMRAWGSVLAADATAGPDGVLERLREVGFFLFELEFPEVFFAEDGTLRPDGGFDVVVGNPPWEAPAKQLKQFLPEFDPDYRTLSGRESLERETELLADPEVARRWVHFQQSVDDYKALLTRSGYESQSRPVRGRLQGTPFNLYMYAVELAFRLLPAAGRAGLVLDGGLWNDLAANGLRRLLIEECRLLAVCGFTNNAGLFEDIHRSYKFGCFVFERGGPTATFPALFMRTAFEQLEDFDQDAAILDAEAIRQDPRDSYPIPEVRGVEHGQAERALSSQPMLGGPPWHLETLSEELHAGRQRIYFRERADGFLPVLQGTHFNHWGVHDGAEPTDWLDPAGEGVDFIRKRQAGRILGAIADFLGVTSQKEAAARAWLRRLTGAEEVPAAWLRLDLDGYRLAWRDICRNDDRRTLIAGILPPGVAVTHKAPFVRPFRAAVSTTEVGWVLQFPGEHLLYLAGMLSSYACDAVARSRMAKTNMTADTLLGLPVPPWQPTPVHRRIAVLAAQLTCRPATAERPWADYTALAAEVGLTPERDGLVEATARRTAEVELNALANRLYGLDAPAFRFLINTLFDTPRHRDTHFEFCDAILAWRA